MIEGPLVAPERTEKLVSECVEPAPQIGLQLAPCREGGHRAVRVHDEKDLIGGGRQISLWSFLSLQGSNAGISTPVAQ
jgi:hypothetical protein